MSSSTLIAVALAALLLALAMAGAFAIRLATGRSGWIDTVWSAAVGCAALLALLPPIDGDGGRRMLAAVIVVLWSARLALHIGARSRGHRDDPRYAALVAAWGRDWRRSLFLFLQAQAAAGLVLVVAVRLAAENRAPFPGLVDLLAVAVAVTALIGEAVADRQLARFRAEAAPGSAGICDRGLWRLSRHPNYLCEWLFWCAWPLLAFDPARPLAALVALAAPLLMGHLLVNVSGIPPLEAHMARTRGAAWEAHRRRVPRFLPFGGGDRDDDARAGS